MSLRSLAYVGPLTALFGFLFAAPLAAQTPEMAPIPESPRPEDLSEVEDVVDDAEVLPKGDEAPQTDAGRANVEAIEAMHAEELSYSNLELRAQKTYGLSAGVGSSRPWQAYTIDAFSLVRPNVAVGMYAGTGTQKHPGAALATTYDLSVEARAFGLSGRYYFLRLDGFSVEALLGYAAWEGKLTPHSGDEDMPSDEDKLSAGYRATGVTGGVGFTVDWVFANGMFIDWTLVGASFGKVTNLNLTRAAPAASREIERDLERGAFYGITNIRVGYFF